MKKFITLMTLCMVCTCLFAIPAKNLKKIIKLADGTTKEVTLKGDEYGHYYEDSEGKTYHAISDDIFTEIDASIIQSTRSTRAVKRNTTRISRQKQLGVKSNANTVGSKKGLVILTNFSDRKMTITNAEFNNYFNQTGYSNYGMSGSVHDYFKDCSYNKFDLTFDVVGPVTLKNSVNYYGKNDSEGNDMHVGEMIIEAVKGADALGTDFTKYDWDGDGYVDQVYVIYAGYAESQGAASSTIWPHEWDLDDAKAEFNDGTGSLKLDGVTINTYACSSELGGTSDATISGIGTACHEFSHCLGIPDFYDTTPGNPNFGMGTWDVMDYGSYNNDGKCPTGYTSYERWVCGWLTPIELTKGCQITNMPSIASSPTAYVIYNEANHNEYYLLENHQKDGWNKYDYGHGMLIIHVDYDEQVWYENEVNNTSSRQRMTIIPADNSYSTSESSLAGDPWPGTRGNSALTNTSTPAAKLYNKNADGQKLMNKPIEDIGENMRLGIISFTFDGGESIDPPTGLKATLTSATSFTASWNKCRATSYQLELTTKSTSSQNREPELILHEDFANFKSNINSDDLSNKLDSYTSTPGWKGSKIFASSGSGAKIGSSKAAGYITTPSLLATSGMATVTFVLSPYEGDDSSYIFSVGDSTGEAEYITSPTFFTYVFDTDDSDFQCTIKSAEFSKCRFYISDLKVYDGEVEDFSDAQNGVAPLRISAKKASTVTYHATSSLSYSFTDRDPDATYTLRIRACIDDRKGTWSDPIQVKLSDYGTAINEIESDAMPNAEKVYNLQGIEVKNTNTKGIYIKNGKKVVASFK